MKSSVQESRRAMRAVCLVSSLFVLAGCASTTPIGRLLAEDFEIVHSGPQASELALSLREELTDIQYGRIPDRHGWLYRLDA